MFDQDLVGEPTAALVAAVAAAGEGPEPGPGQGRVGLAELGALLWCRKRLEALVGTRLAEAADAGWAQLQGWPRISAWAEAEALVDRHEVNSLIRAARAAAGLPGVGQSWRDGGLSTAHVHAAGRATDGLPVERAAQADELLAGRASGQPVPAFTQICHRLRETVMPELVAAELDAVREASHLTLRPVPGGLRISGVLGGDLAERVTAGLDRFSRPLPDDHRDAALRRAEGLALGLSIAATADLQARDLDQHSVPGVTPAELPPVQIQTIVDIRALQRALDRHDQHTPPDPDHPDQPATSTSGDDDDPRPTLAPPARLTLDDLVHSAVGNLTRIPVDWRTLTAQTCHGQLRRLVLTPGSEILDLGRRARLFTPAQRTALLAGRGRCQWARCDNPWVEADHITRYSHGGTTTTTDGRMLCDYHHRLRHRGWTLTPSATAPTNPPHHQTGTTNSPHSNNSAPTHHHTTTPPKAAARVSRRMAS